MRLNELLPNKGQNKNRKRIGRGVASGTGVTSGRGHKGQNCRSGGGVRIGFEGGQMPIHRRLPKRGFKNIFKKEYQIVNVKDLNRFDTNTDINRNILLNYGLIKSLNKPVKILGNGKIEKPLNIHVNKISSNAKAKIEKAGGFIRGVV